MVADYLLLKPGMSFSEKFCWKFCLLDLIFFVQLGGLSPWKRFLRTSFEWQWFNHCDVSFAKLRLAPAFQKWISCHFLPDQCSVCFCVWCNSCCLFQANVFSLLVHLSNGGEKRILLGEFLSLKGKNTYFGVEFWNKGQYLFRVHKKIARQSFFYQLHG